MKIEQLDYNSFCLENKVENKILEVANLFNELTTSDLQGCVMVDVKNIIKLVRENDKKEAKNG